jgi:hypothetical protein
MKIAPWCRAIFRSTVKAFKKFQAFRRGVPPPAVSPKESQWFIEDQAFSQSFDSPPTFCSTPLPSRSSTGDTHDTPGGGRAESYDRKKAWSSVNHSMPPVFHSDSLLVAIQRLSFRSAKATYSFIHSHVKDTIEARRRIEGERKRKS